MVFMKTVSCYYKLDTTKYHQRVGVHTAWKWFPKIIHQTTQLKHEIYMNLPTNKKSQNSQNISWPTPFPSVSFTPRIPHWSQGTLNIGLVAQNLSMSNVFSKSQVMFNILKTLMTKKMHFKNTFLTSTTVGDLEESEDFRLHLEFQADIQHKIALHRSNCWTLSIWDEDYKQLHHHNATLVYI